MLKVIDLLEHLHSKEILHTNLNPAEIFLRDKSLDKMCFLNLYYCSWNTQNTIGIPLTEYEDNLSLFNIKMRNTQYISPEQLQVGEELEAIA